MSITMKKVEEQKLPKKQRTPYQTQQERQRVRYYELKEQGLCVTCKKPLDNNTTQCTSCKEKQKAMKHYNQKQRIRQGLCTSCGKPNTTRYMRCRDCRIKYNEYINKSRCKNE